MLRALSCIMTEALRSTCTPKRVPIPKNGVDYRGKVVLAPMVRSSECPSRLVALKYGADLVWGPETIDKALIGCTRTENKLLGTVDFHRFSSSGQKTPALNPQQRESIIYRLHPELEGKKLIYQIGTASPTLAVQAGRMIAADVSGIDVNAGCPKPFSTHGGMGAALLRTPDTLCAILEALVKEVGEPFEIGISVKIRLLETPEETEALVRRLVKTGITGLTVHCRTTPMRPRERAIRGQLKMVVGVCHEAGVACVMNGDVESREQAVKLMEEYGADAAMIATAAEKNPSVFRSTENGGRAHWKEVAEEFVKTAIAVENRWANTKFELAQLIPGKDPLFGRISTSKRYLQIVQAMDLGELEELAADLDKKLGLDAFVPKAEKRKLAREERFQQAQQEERKSKVAKVENNGGNTSQEQSVAPGTVIDSVAAKDKEGFPMAIPISADASFIQTPIAAPPHIDVGNGQ